MDVIALNVSMGKVFIVVYRNESCWKWKSLCNYHNIAVYFADNGILSQRSSLLVNLTNQISKNMIRIDC